MVAPAPPLPLAIDVALVYRCPPGTPVLAQVEVAATAAQAVGDERLVVAGSPAPTAVPGHGGIGLRRWLQPGGVFSLSYAASVIVRRDPPVLASLPATPLPALPPATIEYLLPSRYCPTDPFEALVASEFAGLAGGALAAALADWVAGRLAYTPGASDVATTAVETAASRQGVCRDYAHLLVALARAGGLPARVASVYAPGVTPPDFHAVAELYLDGGWHLVDATGMATPAEMAVIGVGRDAADVAFLTAFGELALIDQRVTVLSA